MKQLSIFSIAILIISCSSSSKTSEMKVNNIYKRWVLTSLDGAALLSAEVPVFLDFTSDGKISGFAGCNHLNGSFSNNQEGQISFENIASTKMLCFEELMKLEQRLLDILNTVDNYSLDSTGTRLTLNKGRMAPLATFVLMDDNSIVNKYWKLKVLEGKEVMMDDNQEREQYFILRSDGTLSGFAGCNYFNGQYFLEEGNRISIDKNIAVTMKVCPDLNIDEQLFLDVFNTADNYTLYGDTLTLNIGKRAPLAVFEAVYF